MSSRKKLLEEIYDQFLVCKICFDVYTRPKTLACLHTFCEDCIEKHQEAELERAYRYLLYASRTVTCPICRKKTELPPGGVRRLPDNIIVPRLVDIVCGGGRGVTSSRHAVAGNSSNARVTLTCEICKSVSPTSSSSSTSSSPRYAVSLSRDCTSPTAALAVSKCLDCSKMMCSACTQLHRRTKVTQKHSLVDVEVEEKDVACKTHDGELIRFYCEPCGACICVVCAFQEPHHGHDVSTFSEAIDRHRHALDSLLAECRRRADQLRRQLDRTGSWETQVRAAEQQVREAAMDCVMSVRQREKQLLAELRAVLCGDPSTRAFIADRSTVEATLRGLDSTCQLTDIIVRDRSVELLLLKDDIARRMTSLLQNSVAQAAAEAAAASKSVRFVASKKIKLGWLDFGNDGAAAVGSMLKEDDIAEDWDEAGGPEVDCSAVKSSEPKRKRAIEIAHDFEQMNSACRMRSYKTQDWTPAETAAIQRQDKTTMTPGISMVNSETMTLEIPLAASAGFQFRLTESRSTTMSSEVFVENKQTATMSTVQVDRSTLTTRRPALCDKCTETTTTAAATAVADLSPTSNTQRQDERLQRQQQQQQRHDEDEEQQPWWMAGESSRVDESVSSTNKTHQQSTTTTTVTIATETDQPQNTSKSTSTERPFQLDKIVSTPKILQSTRETNTPYIIYLDMAVDTAHIPGDDKACSTRVIVTIDSSTSTDDIDLLPSTTSRQRTSPRLTSRTADFIRRRNVSLDDVDEGRWSWRRSDEILQSADGGDVADDVDMTSSVTLTRSLQLTLPDQSATSCLHDRQDSGVVADVTSGQHDIPDVDRRRFYTGEGRQWSRDDEMTSLGENREGVVSSRQVPTISIDGRLDTDTVDVVQQQEFVGNAAIADHDAHRTISCSLKIGPCILQDSGSNTELIPGSQTVDTGTYRPYVCHVDCNNTDLSTKSLSTTTTTTRNLSQPCTVDTNTALYQHTDTNTDPAPQRQDSHTSTATSRDSWTSSLTLEQLSCSTNTGVDCSDVALPETRNVDTNTVQSEHVSTSTPQRVYITTQTNTATCCSAQTNTAPLPVTRDVITSTPLSSDAATSTLRVDVGTMATNTSQSRDAMTSPTPAPATQSASTNTSQFSDSTSNTVTVECVATATNTAASNDAETNTAARGPEVDASTCTVVFHNVSTCTAQRLCSSSWTNTTALQAAQTNTDSWLSCSDAATDMERLTDSWMNTLPVECNDKCTCTAVHVHQACNTPRRTQCTVETNTVELLLEDCATDTDQLETRTLVDQSMEVEEPEKKEWKTVGTVTDVAGFDDDFDLEEIISFYRQRLLCKPNDALTQTECFVELVDSAAGDGKVINWIDCGYGEAYIDVVDRGCGDAMVDVEERGTGDDSWAQTNDVWTSTLRVTLADRATDMVERHMVSKNEATDSQDVVDVGTSPADDVTSAYRCLVATYQRPTTFSRGTSTPAVPATVECGMLTEQAKLIDAGTSPNPDVTAIYRGRLVGGQHRVTVSRGTLTIQLKSADKETSCTMTSGTGSSAESVERGCSPVRFLGVDKSVSVNRGSLSEPVDVFVRSCNGSLEAFTAGRSTGPRPIHKRLSGSCPRMDIISEQTDESSASSSSDGESTGSTSILASYPRKTSVLRQPFRPVLPARPSLDCLRRLPPSPATVTHRERFCPTFASQATTFGVEGTSQASPVVCRVEVSTNTSSKTFEDKSVGTEGALSSSAVDGKMAECINKLRTVRQRLELQQSSPAGTPPRNVSPPDSTNSPQTASLNTSTSSSSSSPTRPEVDLRRLIAEKCAETPLLLRRGAVSTPTAAVDLASKPEQRGRTSVRHIDASGAFEQPTPRTFKNRAGRLGKDDDVDQFSGTASRTSRTTVQQQPRHDELAELPSSSADSGRKNRLTRPTLFQQRSFSPRARQQRRRADDGRTNISTTSTRPGSAEISSPQQTPPTVRNRQNLSSSDRPRSAVTSTKSLSLSEADEDQQTSPRVELANIARKKTSLSPIQSPQLLRRRRLPPAPESPPSSRPSSGKNLSRTEQPTSTKSPGHGASFTSSIQIKGSSPRLGVRSTAPGAVRVNTGRRPAAAVTLLTEDELRSTTSDSDSLMTQSGSSDDVEPTQQQEQQQQQEASLVSAAASEKMLRSSLARKQRLDIKHLLTARSAASPTDRNIPAAAAAAGASGQQADSRSPVTARRNNTRKYMN